MRECGRGRGDESSSRSNVATFNKIHLMRSFLAILALAGAATGFLEAPIPHQVAPIKASETATFAAVGSTSLFFDDELDNVNIVSDMNIAPSRKCGRCFG